MRVVTKQACGSKQCCKIRPHVLESLPEYIWKRSEEGNKHRKNLLQLTDHHYMNAGPWESTDRRLLVISLCYCILITKAEQCGSIWMTTGGKIHLQIHPSMGG